MSCSRASAFSLTIYCIIYSLSATYFLRSASFLFLSSYFSLRAANSRSRFSSRSLSFYSLSCYRFFISSLCFSFSMIASISLRYLSFILSTPYLSILLLIVLPFLCELASFMLRLSRLPIVAFIFLRGGDWL